MTAHVDNVFQVNNANKEVTKRSSLLQYFAMFCAFLAFCVFAISNSFGAKQTNKSYIENLQTLDSLSSLLIQDYLLVRYNQVKHFDYLESDLQEMKKSAKLTAIVPAYVDREVGTEIQRLSDDYFNQLGSIRNYVELSKRSIGLLSNSSTRLKTLAARLEAKLTEDSNTFVSSKKAAITIDLIYAVNEDFDHARIEKLIAELSAVDDAPTEVLKKIKLHSDMVASYTELSDEADNFILEHASALDQPRKIRELYRAEQTAVYDRNAMLVSIVWIFGVLSMVLFGFCAYKDYGSHRKKADKTAAFDVSVNDDLYALEKVS